MPSFVSPREEIERRKGRKKKILGALMLVGVAVALVWMGYKVLFPPQPPQAQVTAILIDGTDEISRATREAVITEVIGLAQQADSGDVFLFATLTDRDGPLVPMRIEKDRPHPDRCSYLDCNPRMADSVHQVFVASVSDSVSAALSATAPASRSHIMEAVRELSVTLLRRPPYSELRRRLILVSDLLQHSETLSLYDMLDRGQPIDLGAITASWPTVSLLDTDLTGTDVIIYYVPRRGPEFENSFELAQFWSDWVHQQRGVIDRVVRLEGVN